MWPPSACSSPRRVACTRALWVVVVVAGAQEEDLCRRTTLVPSLLDAADKGAYPFPLEGMLVHPRVRILRGPRPAYPWLAPSDHRDVVMLTAAALKHPDTVMGPHGPCFRPADDELMQRKIELLLACAVQAGCTTLVLGAWGCGAYGNPPGTVARLFRRVLAARGASFTRVVFAIVGDGNVDYFRDAFAREPAADGRRR